jgi:hypothetical protein
MRYRLLALLVLLLIGSLGVGLRRTLLALPPTTIEKAVATTLIRVGAPTEDVRVEHAGCVPAQETCLSYIADVVLRGEHETGRLACVGPWHDCTLTMAEFGLRAAPVPDVGQPNPWVARIGELFHQVIVWVQGWV